MGDHGHAGHPRGAVDLSAPGGGLRCRRGGLHIGRPSPVHRGGAHRERPGSRHGACAADGDVPGERLRSAQHKGPSDRPQVVVAFSAPVAAFGADTPSVSTTGASVDGVQRLDKEGLENAYVFFLTPEGHKAIAFRLHANRACTDDGICTADRRQMSNSPSVTVAGPADEPERNTAATGTPTISGTPQVGETLAADTSGIADENGLENVTFSYQWLADDADIACATGSTYTLVVADEGKTVKVRVFFTDDGGNDETLTSAATDAVAAPEPPAKPTGLSATPSHDRVVLTWDDPNDDTITGYVILRRNRETDAQGQFTELAPDTGTAVTTYTDDTVAAETPYTWAPSGQAAIRTGSTATLPGVELSLGRSGSPSETLCSGVPSGVGAAVVSTCTQRERSLVPCSLMALIR